MRYVNAHGGEVTIRLTAEECELISDGVQDGSTPDNPSVRGDLATAFKAFAVVAQLSTEGAE
jgi:hypothetical protein